MLGLVPVLFEVARRGDRVAHDVVLRQAEEICLMATVAAGRLGIDQSPTVPVVLGGGVLTARDPLLSRLTADRLTASLPGADVRIVDVPPVVGAALLGLDHIGASPSTAAHLRASAKAAATWT